MMTSVTLRNGKLLPVGGFGFVWWDTGALGVTPLIFRLVRVNRVSVTVLSLSGGADAGTHVRISSNRIADLWTHELPARETRYLVAACPDEFSTCKCGGCYSHEYGACMTCGAEGK